MKEAENLNRDSIISSFKSLSEGKRIELIASLVLSFKEKPSEAIPVIIFDNDKLSTFEAVVKYMKENLKLRFIKIASLLSRSDKTIWTTYSKSAKKMPLPFADVDSDINVPIENFSDRNFTVFESLVSYLREHGFTNHEIGVMLHRDDRTIWSVYDRAKKKRKGAV